MIALLFAMLVPMVAQAPPLTPIPWPSDSSGVLIVRKQECYAILKVALHYSMLTGEALVDMGLAFETHQSTTLSFEREQKYFHLEEHYQEKADACEYGP